MDWVDVPTDPPEPFEHPCCGNCGHAVSVGLDYGGICTFDARQSGDYDQLRYVDWTDDWCEGWREL